MHVQFVLVSLFHILPLNRDSHATPHCILRPPQTVPLGHLFIYTGFSVFDDVPSPELIRHELPYSGDTWHGRRVEVNPPNRPHA